MEHHYHAVVWIDHRRRASSTSTPTTRIKSSSIPSGRCATLNTASKGADRREKEDQAFLEEVTRAVADAGAILIVGPANEKHGLMKHIERVHPAMKLHVEGVESADHPTDGELVAHARRFVKSADRMRPQL